EGCNRAGDEGFAEADARLRDHRGGGAALPAGRQDAGAGRLLRPLRRVEEGGRAGRPDRQGGVQAQPEAAQGAGGTRLMDNFFESHVADLDETVTRLDVA